MADGLDALQPLVAGTVRWTPDAAVIALADRDVRVGGDPAALREILGACDGRATVRSIADRLGEDARALLAELLRVGAAVDGAEAWRVLHAQSSVGSALGRGASDEELLALRAEAYAPAGAGARTVALAPAASRVLGLAERRRSLEAGAADPPAATFPQLSAVLAAAYGVSPSAGIADTGTVPSAGALYPLVVHLLLRRELGPAEPGLWWSDPRTRALHRVGDVPAGAAALFVPEPGADALVARGGPVVFLSADVGRPSRKYGARGYRYALIEAGAALQSAQLAATEIGVPLRPIGGIDDRLVHRALELPDTAVALLALVVGA